MTSFAMLMLAVVVGAQDANHEFTTTDEAITWLEGTLRAPQTASRPSTQAMDQRVEDVRLWLKRVKELDLDFGEDSYVITFAEYASAGRGRGEAVSAHRLAACDRLLDYGIENDGFPADAKEWNGWIARLATVGFSPSFEDQDWPRARRAVIEIVGRSRDPFMAAQQATKKVVAEGSDDAQPVRVALAVAIAQQDAIDVEEKDLLFRQIYRGGGKGGGKGGEVAFVPFKGPSLDGAEISVADFKGKVLLIDYWATWCGPCLREMPHVVAAWKEFKDDGFAILGVSLDRADAAEKIRTTMKKYGMDWPQIYEGEGWNTKPARMNGVRSIPATYLLDREGNVVATNLRGDALAKKIAEVLAEQPEPAPVG